MKHKEEILTQYMRFLANYPHDNNDVKAFDHQNFGHIKQFFEKFANVKTRSITKEQAIKMIALINEG